MYVFILFNLFVFLRLETFKELKLNSHAEVGRTSNNVTAHPVNPA